MKGWPPDQTHQQPDHTNQFYGSISFDKKWEKCGQKVGLNASNASLEQHDLPMPQNHFMFLSFQQCFPKIFFSLWQSGKASNTIWHWSPLFHSSSNGIQYKLYSCIRKLTTQGCHEMPDRSLSNCRLLYPVSYHFSFPRPYTKTVWALGWKEKTWS